MRSTSTSMLVVMSTLCFVADAAGQQRELQKGIQFLRQNLQGSNRPIGEKALGALALAKTGAAANDPVVAATLSEVRADVGDEVDGKHHGNEKVYIRAVELMLLTEADPSGSLVEIEALTRWLVQRQTNFGAWTYDNDSSGDTSQTQYALLGLAKSASLGVDVPPETFERALQWLLRTQGPDGGGYYKPQLKDNKLTGGGPAKHTMTAASGGSMELCAMLLNLPDPNKEAEEDLEYPYLIPVKDGKAEKPREPLVTKPEADRGIKRSHAWMANNFTLPRPSGPVVYFLYSLERFAAFAKTDRFGPVDWYAAGSKYLASEQQPNGSWRKDYSDIVDTSFAVMFLAKASEKTAGKLKIVQLGSGSMVGGVGMPTEDDGSETSAAMRKARFRNALKTPVDDIISAMADPSVLDHPDAAGFAAAIEQASPEDLLRAAKGKIVALGRLTRSESPDLREAACTALARLNEMTAVPLLIHALGDDEGKVYRAARAGLRFLSRRVDGFGLPERNPKPAQITAAQKMWNDWFDQQRVDITADQRFNVE